MGPEGPPGTLLVALWDLFYFVHWTPLNMKSGCHHHQIGMNYLCDVIFKMAATKIGKIMFLAITQLLM